MRVLGSAAAALLARLTAGEQVPLVQLIELQLSTTVRFTTAGRDVQWGGHTWQHAGAGSVEPIEDAAGELQGLRFVMPGVDGAQIALALVEPVEGRTVRVWDALLDPATGAVADPVLAWAGTLNVPDYADGPTATVSVTAEHRGLSAIRPRPRNYSNEEQQRRFPGDTSLNFDPATDAAPLVWPKASFFKQ